MSAIALPWAMLFPAIALFAAGSASRVAWGLILAGFVLAFAVGQLGPEALATFLLLALAGWWVRPGSTRLRRIAGHVLFLALAVLLRLHVVPGFHNPLVFDVQVSAAAPVHRAYFNLDKLVVALWLLACWPHLRRPASTLRALGRGTAIGTLTAVVCLGAGVLAGLAAWDPKLPEGAWIWTLNTLLLVCFCEEILFRGYVQEGLERAWRAHRWGAACALLAGALLSGLAHFASSASFGVIAIVAGVGYGVAYRLGGLPAAIAAHAALNLLHFFGFSYPFLQQVGHG